ncbi:DUF2787 family protein [Aeromonas caviae]|uniref:DUF2787 domain-containing protein n=1 Tax=Aeromonas caviae TaxID=648 RepID=A0AA37CXR7_AERCA|nr:DUF2787 family protein [Aeromonas caviae]GJA17012.1 hypothetical protein KAM336_00330 [Aeromonas caviae]GJA25946.1 hypothetical protein KAM340_01130 [Aeromonas caviae]GJA63990.1 hypothetical protein KAM351_26010 [Aeromonas caviae]GJA70705.1 hypothetical protein KAM353_03520 [Aeromonas caviae]
MKINAIAQPAGLVLPVTQKLLKMLIKETGSRSANTPPAVAVILNFRDPDYDPDRGGYHPVEIRLINQGETWCLDYVTDFGYVGQVYPELEKIIDISWSQNYVWFNLTGDLSLREGRELYRLWETNFLSYHAGGVYTISIQWEHR